MAIVLSGILLATGACAPAQKAPSAVLIQVVLEYPIEQWRPSTVAVSVGGTVTWTNKGSSQHAVISGEGLFDQELSPGESFNYTFTKRGTYTYRDDPNPNTGVIYVE